MYLTGIAGLPYEGILAETRVGTSTLNGKNIHIFFLNILERWLDDKDETESFI